MAATKTKRPKKKPKLRGGTNQPAEPIEMPAVGELLGLPAGDDGNSGIPEIRNSEANGHVGNLADAVDLVVERAEEHAPINRLTEALAYDSPERLAEWDAETMRLVNGSERECSALKADHEDKAEAAKDAKKKYDLATADHWDLIRRRRNGRGKPVQQELFDKTEGHAAAQPDLREPSEVPPVEDESWKAVPLSELVEKDGLPQKVADLLAEADHKDRGRLAPITTMGELVKYQEPEGSGYTKRLIDLRGFGPAKEEALSKATESFWKRWKPHANAAAGSDSDRHDGPERPGESSALPSGDAQADSPAGGDAAAQAEPEPAAPADAPTPESNGEPAGYHTEGTETIAKRARGRKRKAKGKESAD